MTMAAPARRSHAVMGAPDKYGTRFNHNDPAVHLDFGAHFCELIDVFIPVVPDTFGDYARAPPPEPESWRFEAAYRLENLGRQCFSHWCA